MEATLCSIKAIIILDGDGKRIVAKYYDSTFPGYKEQIQFETKLFSKTKRHHGSEITLLDGVTCLFRVACEVYFYIIGDSNENELLLLNALNTLFDAVNQILKRCVEKRTMMDNLDLLFLVVDELCNNGILMECDSVALAERVGVRSEDVPFGEQTVVQAIQSAKEQLKMSLMR